MADLNKIANNIEEIVELQVIFFLDKAHKGTLNGFDSKSIETLAKTLNICKMWQDKMPSSSVFENLSTAELGDLFSDGEAVDDNADDDSNNSEQEATAQQD